MTAYLIVALVFFAGGVAVTYLYAAKAIAAAKKEANALKSAAVTEINKAAQKL